MARKTGLGRGLDALIPGGDTPPSGSVLQVAVGQISANPRQPRKEIDAAELQDLANSIRQHGILQPLVLTYSEESPGQYVLIAGHRRWLAAQQVGLEQVPAVVREASEQQRLELALIENVQRTDLNPLEQAAAFHQLAEEFGLSHEEIAMQVGKSRESVTNTLRLLKLPEDVQKALDARQISEGHARALLGLPTSLAQSAALKTVLQKGLSVRQTEELVRWLNGKRPSAPHKRQVSPEIGDLENQLRSHLGTKVSLNRHGKGGTLVIHFYSDEELDALVKGILGE